MALMRDAVEQMVRNGREPAIAFRFVIKPLFTQETENGVTKFALGGPLPVSPDTPVDNYLVNHMKFVGTFSFDDKPWVELFVRKVPDHGEPNS